MGDFLWEVDNLEIQTFGLSGPFECDILSGIYPVVHIVIKELREEVCITLMSEYEDMMSIVDIYPREALELTEYTLSDRRKLFDVVEDFPSVSE